MLMGAQKVSIVERARTVLPCIEGGGGARKQVWTSDFPML